MNVSTNLRTIALSLILAGMASAASAQSYTKAQYAADTCLLYTSPSPRDRTRSRMPSSA